MPRARGRAEVATKASKRGTVLDTLHQSGSAKLLFPRGSAVGCEAVYLNTAGGVTGGDHFALSATAGPDTELTVTTQACERAYRAQPGQTGVVRNDLKVSEGSRLNWLPQETILYEGAALDRRLRIDLDPSARLLMVEPVIFGRTAMGESLSSARFRDRIDIRAEGKPLYFDGLMLSGDIAAHLAKPFIAGGAMAMASLVYCAPDAEARLARIRQMLPDTAGASLLQDQMLVLRLLAPGGFELRQGLIPILRYLNAETLPRCWMT